MATTNHRQDVPPASTASYVSQNRQKLSKMLQLHGYSACREAVVLLEDHYTSSSKYDSMEDFINTLNRIITFEVEKGSSVIDSDLAHLVMQKLRPKQQVDIDQPGDAMTMNLNVKIKNVQYDHVLKKDVGSSNDSEFSIHYNFLFKKLSSMPVFRDDFQLTKLSTLTASSQPSIRCVCFGLLIKDISKIDGYLLIDNTGRVPVRITPDTNFRNKLAYTNCIVLVEGVYTNPDDILFAANIGLPPILLDPLQDKSLSCHDDKLVVILREIYLDDDHICNMLDTLFTGYNSMEEPPILFILVGDFSRNPCKLNEFQILMKKFVRILRQCDNLKQCHFVIVPGQHDTSPAIDLSNNTPSKPLKMPKPPLTKEQIPVNLLQIANFPNVHLATNPAHIYLGERLITVVGHNYIKELRNNVLHDLSDHNEELFETMKQIIMSNAHLSAGIDRNFHSSMNLWHRPDLLVLADTEAIGNRYEYNLSKPSDTSFMTLPSFSRQSYQFKVYYINSGEIEESQVSSDVLEEVIGDDEEGSQDVQLIEPEVSELD